MFTLTKEKEGHYKDNDLFFGVELELCVCDKDQFSRIVISNEDEEAYINQVFIKKINEDKEGLTIEKFSGKGESHDYYSWNVVIDKSVLCRKKCGLFEKYHTLELISPILEYNKDGIGLLDKAIDKLNKKFNIEINNTQGLHINMSYYGQERDMRSRDYSKVLSFFEAWFYYEKQILALLPAFRKRMIEDFARPLGKKYKGYKSIVDKLKRDIANDKLFLYDEDFGPSWPRKFTAINMKPDRIEVRIPPPTVDKKILLFWVNLCLLLLKKAVSEKFSVKTAPKTVFQYINFGYTE